MTPLTDIEGIIEIETPVEEQQQPEKISETVIEHMEQQDYEKFIESLQSQYDKSITDIKDTEDTTHI